MKIRFHLSLLTAVLEIAVLANGLLAQNSQPFLSVTVKNTETIAKNLPEIAQASKDLQGSLGAAMLQSYVDQDIIKDAIDLKRPVGLFVFSIGKKEPVGALAVPVKDLDKTFKLLPAPMKAERVSDRNWKIVKDAKALAWVYCLRDWCFLTQFEVKPSAEVDAVAEDVLKKLNEEAVQMDLGVTLYVNAIPEKDRKEALGKFISCAKKEIEKGKRCSGVALADFFNSELDKLAASAERNAYESPISKISSGYVWNSEERLLSCVTSFTGDEAKHQIQDLSKAVRNTETAFANFGTEGSLASFQFNAQIEKLSDPIFEKLIGMRWEHAKKKIAKHHDSKTAEEIVKFIEGNGELFKKTRLNPDVETAGALFAGEKELTVVFARNVPDGYALETEFRKVVNWVEEKKAEKIAKRTENAKRTEDGEFHIFQITFIPKKPLPEKLAPIFDGKVPACVIFAPNAVYSAMGTNAVEKALECAKNAKKEETSVWTSRISAQGFIQAACQYGHVAEGLEEKLKKVGEAEISTKVEGQSNGVRIVTEIPAKVLEMLVLARDAKK